MQRDRERAASGGEDREEAPAEGSAGEREVVDELDDLGVSAELGSLAGVMRELAAPPRTLSLLAPGTVIEETYEVLRVLGVGGMGVVYAARDLRLGREVAVKVHSASDAAARARLVREAEALARHKHPNVVAIYRAGEVQGQVYYAMELVSGGTLRAWLREPRTRKQIVAVLLAAGEGVAAAHRAGLVHRDFKPENVLLDGEARPRVADFGLAIAATARAATAETAAASATSSKPVTSSEAALEPLAGAASSPRSEVSAGRTLEPPRAALGTAPVAPLRVTETRAAVGTPRYMAPEQTRGGAVDERADQFAFCVTAWEALTGRDPFDDAAGAGRLLLIERGPAPARGLPTYLEQVLRRGLSCDVAARYRDMEALLAALRADPAVRRKRWALASGALVLCSATAALALTRDDGPEPCEGPSEVRQVWSSERRAVLAQAFGGDGAAATEWRGALRRRVTLALDERAAQWEQAQRGACRKQQIDRVWTAAQSELASTCLERRLRELDSAIAVLTSGELGGRDLEVVAMLPPVARCLDPAQLTLDRPTASAVPADAEAAAAARAAEAKLDRAARSLDGGDVASAQRSLDEVSDPRALAVPFVAATKADLLARLAIERGDGDMITRLTDAFYQARRAGLLASSVRQAIAAVVTASRNDDRETAERWLRLAEADVSGLALGADTQAQLARSRAVLLHADGRPDDALVEIERALKLMSAAPDDARVISLLMSKASIEGAAGRFSDAVNTGRQLAALIEERYGPYHPSLARTLGTLTLDLSDLGRHDEAIAAAERAISITRAQLSASSGPNLELADHLLNLGVALTNAGRGPEAVEQYRLARAAYVAVHGEAHADAALCDANIAGVLVALKDFAGAVTSGRRSVATFAAVAPEHTEYPTALMNLALAERMTAELAPAVGHIEHAVRLLRAMQGSRVILAGALRTQAWIDLDRGHLIAAGAAAEESLQLWLAGDSSPQEIARSELAVAEVRWRRGERPTARALIEQAIGRVTEDSPVAAELTAWRDAHR